MATFLDVGLFQYFSIIFSFLLVWVVIFGLLEWMKVFGSENKGWHSIIALCIAALTIMSDAALRFLTFVTPWFLVMFFVIFFILFAVRIFGLGEKDIVEVIKDSQTYTWVIVFSIVIVLFGLGQAIGQTALEEGPGAGVADLGNRDIGTVDAGTGTAADSGTSDSGSDSGVPDLTNKVPSGSTATADYSKNVYNTIFNPKVLGMVFLLLIATLGIALLTKPVSA